MHSAHLLNVTRKENNLNLDPKPKEEETYRNQEIYCLFGLAI